MNNKFLKVGFFLTCATTVIACSSSNKKQQDNKETPNVVIIYFDDLGYGDISCNGQNTLITPNIDKFAKQGVRFTEAHCTSATSTPSRYGMLTGTYPWKNPRAQVLPADAPLLITPDTYTLPDLFKDAGYQTAIVGKWHLGLGNGNVNWNGTIKPGPRDLGFDYAFIMAATNDRVPSVFIENEHVSGLDLASGDSLFVSYKHNFDNQPTGKSHPEMLRLKPSQGHNNTIINGISRIGFQKGGKSATFKDEALADTFLTRASDYVRTHKNKPFFLCYTLDQPHVPRVPSERFQGKSGLGSRGDAILEADWCIGQFMSLLKKEGIDDNTIVIISSDNGPVLDDGYYDMSEELANEKGHRPWADMRGGKYSLFEAGTRIPFLVRWPGHTPKNKVSEALFCQMDLMASFGDLLNVSLEGKAKDSKDLLPVLLGTITQGRESLVVENGNGRTAFRKGDWALIPPYPGPKQVAWGVKNDTGYDKEWQLYNLKADIGQQRNLANENPEKFEEMKALYLKEKEASIHIH